jgi:four helix bundle protein
MSDVSIVSFRDLDAWQVTMDLAVAVHHRTESLPASNRYDLGSQLRRAATSVPSNIAEGHAHRGKRTFLRHVRIALGSLAEVETQIELGLRLKFFDRAELETLTELIARSGQLLHGLERSLKKRLRNGIVAGCAFLMTAASITAVLI